MGEYAERATADSIRNDSNKERSRFAVIANTVGEEAHMSKDAEQVANPTQNGKGPITSSVAARNVIQTRMSNSAVAKRAMAVRMSESAVAKRGSQVRLSESAVAKRGSKARMSDLSSSKDISDSIKYPGIKIFQNKNKSDLNAVTLPGFGIYVGGGLSGEDLIKTLQHEYGHFLDYKYSLDLNYNGIGLANFYLMIGLPSIINSALTYIPGLDITHRDYWTETRANQLAEIWFGKNYIHDAWMFPTTSKK